MLSRILTDQQKIDIVNMYINNETLSCEDIAKVYSVNRSAINKILRVRGVPIRNDKYKLRRKYKLNQDYFDNIDSEAKAYFLGLLYADGNNNKDNHCVSINLQERDMHILDSFKRRIKSTCPLKMIFRNKKNLNFKNVCSFRIYSEKISNRLSELGCVPKKSLILQFPNESQVPVHLINHFVRGYFDGDGSLSLNKEGRPNVNLVSTIMFIEKLSEMLENNLGIKGFIYQDKRTIGKTTRQFYITKKEDMKKFLEWIYKDSTIYLDRKRRKYLEVKELCFS